MGACVSGDWDDRMKILSTGFVWLARHPLRREIVSFVTSPDPLLMSWCDPVTGVTRSSDKHCTKVLLHRQVWMMHKGIGGPAVGLRPIGQSLGISHQTVSNIAAAYEVAGQALSHGELPTSPRRLDLRERANRLITREVVSDYLSGELTLADVVTMLTKNDKPRSQAVFPYHAWYWLKSRASVMGIPWSSRSIPSADSPTETVPAGD